MQLFDKIAHVGLDSHFFFFLLNNESVMNLFYSLFFNVFIQNVNKINFIAPPLCTSCNDTSDHQVLLLDVRAMLEEKSLLESN